MASVPNMRLTAAPHGKEGPTPAETVGADLFARLLTTMPALEPGAEAALVPGAGETPELATGDSRKGEEGADALSVDIGLPAQAAQFLPLIEAQAAAPVTVTPAPAAVVTAPTTSAPAEITAIATGATDTLVEAQIAGQPVADPATTETTAARVAASTARTVSKASAVETAKMPEGSLPVAAEAMRTKAAPAGVEPGPAKPPAPADAAVDRPAQPFAAASSVPTEQAVAAPRPARKTSAPVTRSTVDTAAPATSASAAPTPAPLSAFGLVTAADLVAATASAPADAPAAPTPAEILMEHELDLARDSEWLDQLARDIAGAGEADGPMRFRLNPQTLGHLRVELTQSDQGTSVRLTAETEAARSILADAQPRLLAEARAQGLRISDTHVDLAGSGGNGSADARRQDGDRPDIIIRTATAAAGEADDKSAAGPTRSERYA